MGHTNTQGKKEESPHEQGAAGTPRQSDHWDITMSWKLQGKKTTRAREKTGSKVDTVVSEDEEEIPAAPRETWGDGDRAAASG